VTNLFDDRIIAIWDPPILPDSYREPLVSDAPTLFLAGALDVNTPPFQAEEVRGAFTNARRVIVRHAGHEQILGHPHVQRTIARFRAGDDVSDATATAPPLRFIPLEGPSPDVFHPSIAERN